MSPTKEKPKVAIVADWLVIYGGAEQVISAIHEMYPEAPIYTTLFWPEKMKELAEADVRVSHLQKIPFAKKKHRWFLQFMPHAVERMDLSEYDIVISSCHSVAKGVITKPQTLHVSYCHSPMRYCWDNWQEYLNQWNFRWPIRNYIFRKMHDIRSWDRAAAERVDSYIANSAFVGKRISKYYRKDSHVIPPPVDTERFVPSDKPPRNYFLAAGRLIPYKRFDLLVETFNRLGWMLKIAGTGPELEKLKKMAKPNVEFLGFVSDEKLVELYQRCNAFLFPQVEDAGITPLEAMACGRPVIALGEGGATETVIEGKTGMFFEKQEVVSLLDTLNNFKVDQFDPKFIRQHAEKYSRESFQNALRSFVDEKWGEWKKTMR